MMERYTCDITHMEWTPRPGREDLNIMTEWCRENFGEDSFQLTLKSTEQPRRLISFPRAEHATIFKLRWVL